MKLEPARTDRLLAFLPSRHWTRFMSRHYVRVRTLNILSTLIKVTLHFGPFGYATGDHLVHVQVCTWVRKGISAHFIINATLAVPPRGEQS